MLRDSDFTPHFGQWVERASITTHYRHPQSVPGLTCLPKYVPHTAWDVWHRKLSGRIEKREQGREAAEREKGRCPIFQDFFVVPGYWLKHAYICFCRPCVSWEQGTELTPIIWGLVALWAGCTDTEAAAFSR